MLVPLWCSFRAIIFAQSPMNIPACFVMPLFIFLWAKILHSLTICDTCYYYYHRYHYYYYIFCDNDKASKTCHAWQFRSPFIYSTIEIYCTVNEVLSNKLGVSLQPRSSLLPVQHSLSIYLCFRRGMQKFDSIMRPQFKQKSTYMEFSK